MRGIRTKRLGAALLALTAAMVMSAAVMANDCVVDRNHPEASDSNPGTESAPWKTIEHAAQSVKPGDTVYVMEGAYDERVILSQSGTPDKWVTFKAVPKHAAVMRGFDTGKAEYVRIEGFKVTSKNPQLAKKLFTAGIQIRSDHVEVLDNLLCNIFHGIAGNSKRVRVAYNRIYHVQFGLGVSPPAEHWVIEHNEICRIFKYFDMDCDYSRMWGKDLVVRYNRFHGTRRGTTPGEENEVGKAHLDIVQTFAHKEEYSLTNLEFAHNVCFVFSQGLMANSRSHPGNIADLTFRNNIFAAGGAWGLCCHKVHHLKAVNNTFVIGPGAFGVGLRNDSHHGVIENNILCNAGAGAPGLSLMAALPHSIKGNLVHNSKMPPDAGPGEAVKGNPKFADPERRNFRLTRGSPAIDAGEGGRDIGALEYPNVYHVNPRHPGASDDGFGYPGWPFRTVAAALKMAQPGETVILRGGTYRELIAPPTDGVTLRAAEGEKVVVSGDDLIIGWKRMGNGRWSAPLAAKPVLVLKDGKPFSGFTYDGTEKKILVEGFDPRLRAMETVVRSRGIDLAGKENVKVIGLETVSTPAMPLGE